MLGATRTGSGGLKQRLVGWSRAVVDRFDYKWAVFQTAQKEIREEKLPWIWYSEGFIRHANATHTRPVPSRHQSAAAMARALLLLNLLLLVIPLQAPLPGEAVLLSLRLVLDRRGRRDLSESS